MGPDLHGRTGQTEQGPKGGDRIKHVRTPQARRTRENPADGDGRGAAVLSGGAGPCRHADLPRALAAVSNVHSCRCVGDPVAPVIDPCHTSANGIRLRNGILECAAATQFRARRGTERNVARRASAHEVRNGCSDRSRRLLPWLDLASDSATAGSGTHDRRAIMDFLRPRGGRGWIGTGPVAAPARSGGALPELRI